MYDDPLEQSPPELPAPPPELRERVLASCRREMEVRRAVQGRRRQQWRWSLAAGVVGLLLFNAAAEQRSATRIATMIAVRPRMVQAPREAPAAAGSLRARRTLLAALLRDPNAL